MNFPLETTQATSLGWVHKDKATGTEPTFAPAAAPSASLDIAPQGAYPAPGLREAPSDQPVTLHLGLFFDGTGNNKLNAAAAQSPASAVNLDPDAANTLRTLGCTDAGAAPNTSYGNDLSNIARLHDLYPNHAEEPLPADAETAYLPVYIEGIGTRSGRSDSLFGECTGRGSTGVLARVEQVPELVVEQMRRLRKQNPRLVIRDIVVDLFGFSRGAAAARYFANDLRKGPASALARFIPPGSVLLPQEFDWRIGHDLALNFIGLFDTVAHLSEPLLIAFNASSADNAGVPLHLPMGCARAIVQLAARDEYRRNFALTRTDYDVEVPGSHSDVGGSYRPVVTERVLLSRPDSACCPVTTANEHSQAWQRTQAHFERTRAQWLSYFAPEELSVVTWDVPVPGREKGQVAQKRVYAALRGSRQVRGELSLVYLHAMRAAAERAGVAFKPITAPGLAVPAELHGIADKLQAAVLGEAGTGLSDAEYALLRRHYIHLSANWNAALGRGNSRFDAVFINRPAKGNQRTFYGNE